MTPASALSTRLGPSVSALTGSTFRCRRRTSTRKPSSRTSATKGGLVRAASEAKPVLYDVPVSNNGARCRLILYWKQLEDAFAITDPSAIGGIKSDEYLRLNPQGKMPLLVLPDELALPESEVISQYICHAYEDVGPSLIPEDPETRAVAALATRIHDVYIVPIQERCLSGLYHEGAMYRGPMDVAMRAEGIASIAKQLDVIEGIMSLCPDGPFIAGAEPSTADAALFPTWVFIEYILPKHFGWADVFGGRPHTKKWWDAMCVDTCGARVLEEVRGGLLAWEESGRWAKVGVDEAVKDREYVWAY